ncbi:MAG: hypothetical protein RJA76_2072 [Bacteroidota bacterium]
MHFLKELECDRLKVLLYEWNSKYIVKYETSSMEQTIKFSILDFTSEKEIEELATSSSIVNQVILNFENLSKEIKNQLL